MNTTLRSSSLRAATGACLLLAAGGVLFFVLPDAAQQRLQKQAAFDEAKKSLALQSSRLADLEAEQQRIDRSRKRLEALFGAMPDQSAGQLQWALSRRLYELAGKSGVRLQSLKYGAPSREGAKGTDLEVLDVDFTATGVYQNLKPFMLGLENTQENQIPFAVASAKLEESPDGARLSVTLRAFRRAPRGRQEGS